jgi:PBSX family phage terminase large subunit
LPKIPKVGWELKHRPTEKLTVKYAPLKHQKEFSKLLAGNKRIVLFLGGIRSGKTYAGAREALKRIYTEPITRGIGWIVSPTYPMSLVVEREFESAADGIIIKKYKGERAYLLYPPKGCDKPYRVEVKSAEEPDRLRGASLDWIWMDEAAMMTEDCWKILLGRVLDSQGKIFMTTTPRGRNWLYREVFERADKDDRIAVVRATTSENIYLNKEDVGHLRNSYSASFARQELEGEFVSFDGLVYQAFDFRSHVVPPITRVPSGAEIIGGIDTGFEDPFVHLWVMKSNHNYYVIDEYFAKHRTIENHAQSIKASKWDALVMRRWADPSSAQERTDLDRHNVSSYPANNDIKAGINCVERLLEVGRLYVAQNCVNLLSEIGQYQYKVKDGKNTKDEPVDYANHTMDALRYAIYSEEGYNQAHPFITTNEDGSMELHGITGNPLSNRLEDWIAARALPVIELEDGMGDE